MGVEIWGTEHDFGIAAGLSTFGKNSFWVGTFAAFATGEIMTK